MSATYGTGNAKTTTRQARTPRPAISRVAVRRDMPARLRAVDPFAVAPGEPLVLPDRDGRLEVVDQRPARVERGAAVASRDRDHHGQVADRQIADPVHGRDCMRVESLSDLLGDLAQLVCR